VCYGNRSVPEAISGEFSLLFFLTKCVSPKKFSFLALSNVQPLDARGDGHEDSIVKAVGRYVMKNDK